MNNNGIRAYRKTTVITADPGKLILMCYEGAIDQLKITKIKYLENKFEAKCKALQKAMDFIDELLCSLDLEKGGAIARNLSDLYKYMNRKILLADINKDLNGIDEVIGILSELLSAWEVIINGRHKKTQHEPVRFKEESIQHASNFI
ncbi:MAG: flagellar export chaperone FliS [Proteobacteria bacterium]|nr:flagellar export chaperone FliS [Pseudomonadota bacterium]